MRIRTRYGSLILCTLGLALMAAQGCDTSPVTGESPVGMVGCWKSSPTQEPQLCLTEGRVGGGWYLWNMDSVSAVVTFRRDDGSYCGAHFDLWWVASDSIHFYRGASATAQPSSLDFPIVLESRLMKVKIQGEWVPFERVQ